MTALKSANTTLSLPRSAFTPARSRLSRRQLCQRMVAAPLMAGALGGIAACSKAGASVSGIELENFADKSPLRLSEWVGKPFLINYWATNCVTCMHEMPQLVSLYQQWQPYGFNILGISVPWDREDFIQGVIDHYELPFPIAFDEEGTSLGLVETFKGTPTNLLINPDGNVDEVMLGVPDFGQVAQKLGKWLDVGVPS